jgi:hypothetical protein
MLVGFVGGCFYGFCATGSRSTLNGMADVAQFSMYLSVQRSSGTDAAYEEALKAFLLVFEQLKNKWNPTWPESIYAADTALTYARLAALARKRDAENEAAECHWRASEAAFVTTSQPSPVTLLSRDCPKLLMMLPNSIRIGFDLAE